MATLDNGAILRAVYDAWNDKDLDKAVSYSQGDANATNVAFGTSLSFRDYLQNWATAFPDGKVEVANLVAQGDLVVAEFIGRGTHTGVLKGPGGNLAPTGKRLEMRFVEIWEFRNGKISGGRMYFDSATLLKQLGLGPEAVAKAGPQRAAAAAPVRH